MSAKLRLVMPFSLKDLNALGTPKVMGKLFFGLGKVGVKADFTIKPGQKISYYVKLVDWYEGCSSPSFGVSSKNIAANA